jgi:hypothetical protein
VLPGNSILPEIDFFKTQRDHPFGPPSASSKNLSSPVLFESVISPELVNTSMKCGCTLALLLQSSFRLSLPPALFAQILYSMELFLLRFYLFEYLRISDLSAPFKGISVPSWKVYSKHSLLSLQSIHLQI